jgi:hypothetical protein
LGSLSISSEEHPTALRGILDRSSVNSYPGVLSVRIASSECYAVVEDLESGTTVPAMGLEREENGFPPLGSSVLCDHGLIAVVCFCDRGFARDHRWEFPRWVTRYLETTRCSFVANGRRGFGDWSCPLTASVGFWTGEFVVWHQNGDVSAEMRSMRGFTWRDDSGDEGSPGSDE